MWCSERYFGCPPRRIVAQGRHSKPRLNPGCCPALRSWRLKRLLRWLWLQVWLELPEQPKSCFSERLVSQPRHSRGRLIDLDEDCRFERLGLKSVNLSFGLIRLRPIVPRLMMQHRTWQSWSNVALNDPSLTIVRLRYVLSETMPKANEPLWLEEIEWLNVVEHGWLRAVRQCSSVRR